jgi:hypothetical protein
MWISSSNIQTRKCQKLTGKWQENSPEIGKTRQEMATVIGATFERVIRNALARVALMRFEAHIILNFQ